MAQFMPSFAEQQSNNNGAEIKFTNNEDDLEEDRVEKSLNHKFCFIFIIDRSTSMRSEVKGIASDRM